MTTLHGSVLAVPAAPGRRGTLATVSTREGVVRLSVLSILGTRQGERFMLPDYGIPDFAFAVKGAGFAASVGYFLRRQILKYEPLVERADVRDGSVDGAAFSPHLSADEHAAAVEVTVTVRGSNTPLNMVFGLWDYRRAA